MSFSHILAAGDDFFCDLIHAWTPRERVRLFVEKMRLKRKVPLIVHLEDNEEYLSEVRLGKPFKELASLPQEELDVRVQANAYHPLRGKHFLDQAQGLSVIINSLSRFNPGHPLFVLPPTVDDQLFFPRSVNEKLRHQLEIPEETIVLVYTDNVHAGNLDEVGELYNAVSVLNQNGKAAVLLRTGQNIVTGETGWNTSHEIPLGWVKRDQLPNILAAADFLIQPGKPGPFNNERVPNKLPEYFAMGRPVVLPRTNLGLEVIHNQEAYVLHKAVGPEIARAVLEIVNDTQLRDRLSHGARSFYETHLASPRITPDLLAYYCSINSTYIDLPHKRHLN
jgi:glycosyltransferase involved in cell wall biosynthesis